MNEDRPFKWEYISIYLQLKVNIDNKVSSHNGVASISLQGPQSSPWRRRPEEEEEEEVEVEVVSTGHCRVGMRMCDVAEPCSRRNTAVQYPWID